MRDPQSKEVPAEASGKNAGEQQGSENHEQWLKDAGLLVACDSSNGYADRVMNILTRTEGQLNTIAWHDGEHGISVGIAQWNQKRGDLPQLVQAWAEADPDGYKDTFGHYAARMHNEDFIRKAHITRDSDLGLRFAKMVEQPSFQKVEIQLMHAKIDKAVELSHHYGHCSELFVAEVTDIANQMGWAAARKALRDSNARHIKDEHKAYEALSGAVQDKRVHGKERDKLLEAAFSSKKFV